VNPPRPGTGARAATARLLHYARFGPDGQRCSAAKPRAFDRFLTSVKRATENGLITPPQPRAAWRARARSLTRRRHVAVR